MILGDPLLPIVGKPDVVENDGHSCRPEGPDARVAIRGGRHPGRHRRVEQPEDPFRRSHGGLQNVVLLGEVLQRLEEASHELQERGNRAHRDRVAADTETGGHQQAGQRKGGQELDDREIQGVDRDRFEMRVEVRLVEGIEATNLVRFA